MTQTVPLLPRSSSPLPRPSASSSEAALTLLGPSAAMAQLWSQLRRLAPHVRTVLLTGEPDCGQEAIARVLLDLSPQNRRTFLRLSADDAESRLPRPAGLVNFPSDVLLFLPDVHQFSPGAQEALLRLMRMRRARGFTVVAAAAEDLRVAVGTGAFSSELAHVLSGVSIAVPSLRKRSEDLPMLVHHMLTARSTGSSAPPPQPTEEFLRAVMDHAWTGNLRELTETLVAICKSSAGQALQAVDLYSTLAARGRSASHEPTTARLVSLDAVMQEHIHAVLRACRGNKLRAAEVLGISRSTLYRMLESNAVAGGAALSLAS